MEKPFFFLISKSIVLRIWREILWEMVAFSEGRGVSKGGKSWFAVESKTLEISIEEIRGKPRGVIL